MYGVTAFFVVIGVLWAFYIMKIVAFSLYRPGLPEGFEEWAFGPGPFNVAIIDRMNAWNSRHGERSGLVLKSGGNIVEDLACMRIIWECFKATGEYPNAKRFS